MFHLLATFVINLMKDVFEIAMCALLCNTCQDFVTYMQQ